MKTATRTLILRSTEHYGKRVPPHAFGEIMRTLPTLLRQSTRMSFEGRSTARGVRPKWLAAATDVRFVDHDGTDETILYFEAPVLGEAASELYEQTELWASRPSPDDTAFDLFADVVKDVHANRRNSDRFDRPLLRRLHEMGRRGLNSTFQECQIASPTYSVGRQAVVDNKVVMNADTLTRSTPNPQQIRIAGVLDMIRVSTNTLAIKLNDGLEIKGALANGNAAQYRHLLEQNVTLLGKAVFRPSGNLLRVDVIEVRSMRKDDALFTSSPSPRLEKITVKDLHHRQLKKGGVAAIIGQWPGEETDEQVERALQELN